MKSKFENKFPPIDCFNDKMMVMENLRVPVLFPLNIERSFKEDIKKAKKDFKKLRTNIGLNNLMSKFNELWEHKRLNCTNIKFIFQ